MPAAAHPVGKSYAIKIEAEKIAFEWAAKLYSQADIWKPPTFTIAAILKVVGRLLQTQKSPPEGRGYKTAFNALTKE